MAAVHARAIAKAKPVSFNFPSWRKVLLLPIWRLGLALSLIAIGLTGCVVYPVDTGPAYYDPGPYYYYAPHYYYGPHYYHPYYYHSWGGCYRCR